MDERISRDTLLANCRVLDLTDDKGYLCGKILGDMGADVIKIEKPGGDPSRNRGPFYQDIPHPEKSLFWFAYNNNKRGITLDIQTADGKELLKRLVKVADFLVESFPPGYMKGLGLGYSELRQVNPRLIMASITPFGQEGPHSGYKAPDLVGMAISGHMYLTGDPDRPPVRISFPQAYLHASIWAVVGMLSAYYYRESTGKGQYVDVSMQEAVMGTITNASPAWDLNKLILKRVGPFWMVPTGARQRQLWRCKDGLVTLVVIGGPVGAQSNRALVAWMDSEGMADDFLKGLKWDKLDMGTITQDFFDRVGESIGKFFSTHTKDELYKGAIKWGVWLYPVCSIAEIRENPQLRSRGYWKALEHPELGATFTYPGAFIQVLGSPLRLRRRAPLIGEHNLEVYGKELGLSREEIILLKQAGVL